MEGFVHIPYRRRLEHPPDAAFAWLTDFDDEDGERAGAVLGKRRILERDKDRMVADNVNVGMARALSGVGEVTLAPPDRWEARIVNAKGRVVMENSYRLRALDGGRATELTIDYHFAAPRLRHKLRLTVGRPLVRRELARMWDGYVAAMDRELSGPDPTGRADS